MKNVEKSIDVGVLKGSIRQRGKHSWRVRLTIGRGPDGKYIEKTATVRGRKQDAIDLLTRWNVELLDNTIVATTHQTIAEKYREWIALVRTYKQPNTARFYEEKWRRFILDAIGHYVYYEVPISVLQMILLDNPNEDKQIKNAMSAFFGWLVSQKLLKENPCSGLLIKPRDTEKTEEDVWNLHEVKRVYSKLTFKNLYDIFIVLGVECGMRPQEILGLMWDKVYDDYISVERAVKLRKPNEFILGATKTRSSRRYWPLTPYVQHALMFHRMNQQERILTNRNYIDNNLVVADKNGNVPCLRYIRRYMKHVAAEAGVKPIPPKNLRATWASLMNLLNVPLPIIQQGAGHEIGSSVTQQHYIAVFFEGLRNAAMALHYRLHIDTG
ncbi:MAG: site-specific integrase [Limnochordia bacterium]